MNATKWWCFDQNNSGGWFAHDAEAGIGYAVFVEAKNQDEASARAMDIGIYFDGVRDGIDCGCCGDRWDEPREDGSNQPEKYGQVWRAANANEQPTREWGIPSYIHPLDGAFHVAVEDGEA